MKLITLPFAGGSASNYFNWIPYLHKDIELVPIELAGRGRRLNELLYTDISDMTEDVFGMIKNEIIDSRYMIFGHSLGALLAFELAHKIKESNLLSPLFVCFSGRYSPNSIKSEEKILHNLSPDEFKREIMLMGGTSTEIFENPELANLFLPVIRNDIKIAETYRFINHRAPLDCDFTILSGTEEEYTNDQLADWRTLTTKKCDFYQFEGGHFFIHEEREKVIDLLNMKFQAMSNEL